jgi:hypothetical protein
VEGPVHHRCAWASEAQEGCGKAAAKPQAQEMIRLGVMLAITVVSGHIAISAEGEAKDEKAQKIEICIDFKARQYAKLCESAATVADAIAHFCAPAPLGSAPSKDLDLGMHYRHEIAMLIHRKARADALVQVLDLRTQAPPACSNMP